MTTQSKTLSQKLERVQNSVQQLPAAAATLNTATDQLGKAVAELDGVLKKFSLGIPTWVEFKWADAPPPHYYHEDIGYAKIGGRWGIAIRTVAGVDSSEAPPEDIDQWLFNDAPRLLRVHAVDKIPELLEAMLAGAAAMAKEISEKADEMGFLTTAINSAINPSQKGVPVEDILHTLRSELANVGKHMTLDLTPPSAVVDSLIDLYSKPRTGKP